MYPLIRRIARWPGTTRRNRTRSIAGGRRSRRAGGAARTTLSAADRHKALSAPDLDCLATAAYLIGQDAAAVDGWTRAFNEYLGAQEAPRAARCAFWIVLAFVAVGEWPRASGCAAARRWQRRRRRRRDRPPPS